MSCKNVAPIQLPTGKNQPCTNLCRFTYNYGNASCVLTNKEFYLDINCFDGKNEVKFTGYSELVVRNVRLYCPPVNYYQGGDVDAELVIKHDMGGTSLMVCIPIESTRGHNDSTRWFQGFASQIPTNANSGQMVSNTNNFTLNNVIPKAPYYFLDGASWDTKFEYGCNQKDKMIIFDPTKAAKINYKDLVYIKNRITKFNTTHGVAKGIMYNKTGTLNGPGQPDDTGGGSGSNMTCVPVTDMVGRRLGGGSTKMLDWIMPKGQNGEKFNFEKHVLPYLIPIICIMFVLALIFFFKMMHSGFKRSKGGGAAAVATAPPPTN